MIIFKAFLVLITDYGNDVSLQLDINLGHHR